MASGAVIGLTAKRRKGEENREDCLDSQNPRSEETVVIYSDDILLIKTTGLHTQIPGQHVSEAVLNVWKDDFLS